MSKPGQQLGQQSQQGWGSPRVSSELWVSDTSEAGLISSRPTGKELSCVHLKTVAEKWKMANGNKDLERVETDLEILQISPPTSLVEKLEGRDTEELVERMQVLRTIWKNFIKKAQKTPAKLLV